jgi:hypothetical protein
MKKFRQVRFGGADPCQAELSKILGIFLIIRDINDSRQNCENSEMLTRICCAGKQGGIGAAYQQAHFEFDNACVISKLKLIEKEENEIADVVGKILAASKVNYERQMNPITVLLSSIQEEIKLRLYQWQQQRQLQVQESQQKLQTQENIPSRALLSPSVALTRVIADSTFNVHSKMSEDELLSEINGYFEQDSPGKACVPVVAAAYQGVPWTLPMFAHFLMTGRAVPLDKLAEEDFDICQRRANKFFSATNQEDKIAELSDIRHRVREMRQRRQLERNYSRCRHCCH